MNNNKRTFYAVWLIALVLGWATLFTACQATPKRIAYTTLNSVALSVDAARAAYVDTYNEGKIDAPTHAKVLALDENYTKAMLLAIKSARYDWTAPVPTEVSALAVELVTLIGDLTK